MKGNKFVEGLAERENWRVMELEDGEVVIALRRGKVVPRYPSGLAHAGWWGEDHLYVTAMTRSVRRWARAAQAIVPELEDRSSDAEVLLLGSVEAVKRLLCEGPAWARPYARRRQVVLSDEERQRRRERMVVVRAARQGR